tara:strand:- start:15813 stop:17558 length:1746 start_codon:yes stop_codon:yes gene_type:complete
MSTKVAEIISIIDRDDAAAWVTHLWDKFNNQRREKIEEWNELRNYIFATDTTTTSNQSLPWKNSTTLPKLCQIRDNLHSNYITALFPNENWLQWEAESRDSNKIEKAQVIEGYMANKCRKSGFRTTVSKMVYDYIDYGNAFSTVSFETKFKINAAGEKVIDYMGCKAHRISPLDIVFNPLAASFDDSFKIIRSIKTLGELQLLAQEDPDQSFWQEALDKRMMLKSNGGFSIEDFDKALGFSVDGFGSYYEYLQSDFVEVLEFYGDYHDQATGELTTNRLITIVDRTTMVRDIDIPTYSGKAPIRHVGWRLRPDNLWAMGALDNLVGMQYRIDHLENLAADAMDLIVHPPLKIKGEVEEFEWAPGAEIHLDAEGDVSEVAKSLNGMLTADSKVQSLEDKMELFAGAPREAMGIRSPGEKTAFEVDQLASAAGRIFHEKTTSFELLLLEPTLNDMLEVSHRNLVHVESIGILDSELDAVIFVDITKADLTGDGVIHPVGARHFAEQAKFVQDFAALANSNVLNLLAPHISSKALAQTFASALNVEKLGIFQANIAIQEQMETERLMKGSQEQMAVEEGQEVIE